MVLTFTVLQTIMLSQFLNHRYFSVLLMLLHYQYNYSTYVTETSDSYSY